MTDSQATAAAQASNCVFCRIASGGDPAARIVHQDDEFVAFHDIRPSAKAHLLIVPRRHTANVKELTPSDGPMLERMRAIGERLLTEQGIPASDQLFGFHVPPFTTVGHLHLHLIGRPFLGTLKAAMFPDWEWQGWWIRLDRFMASLERGRAKDGDAAKWSWAWTKL